MSAELIKQLKKAREVRVPSGDLTFVITRPTDNDILVDSRTTLSELDYMTKYVVGWEGVTARHIVASAEPDPIAFDKTLFKEWIADKTEHWEAIITGITNALIAHREKVLEEQKK